MSYNNPNIPLIQNPIGLDKVIQEIQLMLAAGVPWLDKSFGRAWLHNEKDGSGKVIKIPKCYSGNGEYINVLPNDNLISQSFISVKGIEKYENFSKESMGLHKKRDLSVIIWADLRKINMDKDYIFIEELRKQVEQVLIEIEAVISFNGYADEKSDVIFADYTINDTDTQYLMYPYVGMRFDVSIAYFDYDCRDYIETIQPVLYIKDFTVVEDGFFVDHSGSDKQIAAAKTIVESDSLIMPSNDLRIISALKAANLFSTFYTDNSHPKKVLLSSILSNYNVLKDTNMMIIFDPNMNFFDESTGEYIYLKKV